MLGNIIVIIIIAAIVGGALAKIVKDKKNGSGCASCPYNSSCTTKPSGPTQSMKTIAIKKDSKP